MAVDWATARRLWESNTFGTVELARRVGCSKQAVQWHKKRENWQRAALPAVTADIGKKLDARDAEIRGLRQQHQLQQGGLRLLLSILLKDMQRGTGESAELHQRSLALRSAIQSARLLAEWELLLAGVSYADCLESELPNAQLDEYENELRQSVKIELRAEIEATLKKPEQTDQDAGTEVEEADH